MTYIKTEIPGVWIVEPKVFNDARGYFMEAWKKAEFEEHVGKIEFVQEQIANIELKEGPAGEKG